MKKFIVCVVAGYALVFMLFIGLPQMMGGRGGGTFSKDGGRGVLPETVMSQSHPPSEALPRASSPQPPQVAAALLEDEHFKRYETGPVETFYRNGTLSSEWILNPEGGGIFKTYTPEGRPWHTLPFVNSVLEGDLKIFYPQGPLFSRESYLAGNRKGSLIWYYEKGHPWLEIVWDSDGTAVLSALYSENGKSVALPAVQAEQNTGYFKAFDEKGHEIINLQQSDGEQNSVLKSYYQSGLVSAEVGLRGKRLHGRLIRYSLKGAVWMETSFLEGRLAQSITSYRENKEISFTESFAMEPQSGFEWTAYYPDGRVFWQLTKFASQEESASIFQLTTHWQDETFAGAKQERALL